MNSKKIEISLNSYLPSLLNGLEGDGIKIDNYLKNPFIRKLELLDPDCYIPNKLLEEFLVGITRDLGIVSLSKDLGHHFKATKMGRFSTHIFKSPNFLTFLQEVVRYQHLIRSNYEVKLQVLGPLTRFSVKINETPSHGKLICEEIDIMRILDAFQLIGGSDFTPFEIGVTSKFTSNIEAILPRGTYKLRLDQDESWVLFDTFLLSKKIPNILEKSTVTDIIQSHNPESFKIELLLDSFKVGHIPNMVEVAEMFDISKRTLERNLHDEASSFSSIKEKYLQRKSYELLKESNLSIKEIAEQLAYSNSQNYIRSFKRWTGSTPSVYRASY